MKGLFDCVVIPFLQCRGGEERASFTQNLILLLLYLFSGELQLGCEQAINKKRNNVVDTVSSEYNVLLDHYCQTIL